MTIKHNPTDSDAFNGKGNCLYYLNSPNEAIASFDMAIKLNPNNSFALNNRKLLLEKLKSPSQP
jgi:hypothetical protein